MESEDSLIQRIARTVPSGFGRGKNDLSLGIGDDAAILRPARGMEWVLSCDAFLEGIHFLDGKHPPDSVGYKALARATSDLAAMGAIPRWFLMALVLPKERTGSWLDHFLSGLKQAAKQLGMVLIGGDTSRSASINISMTVIGEVEAGYALTRSAAKPGDLIYTSGELGRAKLGLERLLRGKPRPTLKSRLLRPHLYPEIRVGLGRFLSRKRIASAAIDISDGLSTDLTRLAGSSEVGAVVYADKIPTIRVPTDKRHGRLRLSDAMEMALHGGEDYELLFTVLPSRARQLKPLEDNGDVTCIGEITRKRQVLLVDRAGNEIPLKAHGWDPFRA